MPVRAEVKNARESGPRFGLYFRETSGHETDRLIPGGFSEFAVFFDERHAKTVGMIDKVIAEPSFDTERSLVRPGDLMTRCDLDNFVVLHVQFELAPHAAVGTGGS